MMEMKEIMGGNGWQEGLQLIVWVVDQMESPDVLESASKG